MNEYIDVLKTVAYHARRVNVFMDMNDRHDLAANISNTLKVIPNHKVPSHYLSHAINAANNAYHMVHNEEISSKLMAIVATYCEIMVIVLKDEE